MLSLLFFITFSSSITPPTKRERERDKETRTTLQQWFSMRHAELDLLTLLSEINTDYESCLCVFLGFCFYCCCGDIHSHLHSHSHSLFLYHLSRDASFPEREKERIWERFSIKSISSCILCMSHLTWQDKVYWSLGPLF